MRKKDKAVILIVDDRQSNILALENLLADKDRVILQALSGKEALQTALNNKPDLIILDVQMPGMDGFEVAAILKSNKRTSDIPIIFASAEKKEHQFMMKGFDEGAIDYLFKPLNPGLVKAKVAVFLKLQLQKKELLQKNVSLQKSALLIDNSADIIGIIDSETYKIEEINNAFTHILGYTKEEAKGTALTFYLKREEKNLPELVGRRDKDYLNFETQVYARNHSIKWLQWKVVVKDKKWFVNARDITEIKLSEKMRNYLAAVVKQSNDAIYIHDHEGKIISWNQGAERVYGYTEKEALKMKIWNIIPDYLRTGTGETIAKILLGEKISDIETRRITKKGKLLDVLFSAAVLDTDEKKGSIVITERDITKQKISDEEIRKLNDDLKENVLQLEASNKEMESFSYSISHDLRAPLRALTGYSVMLEEDYANTLEEGASRLINNIKFNSQKMGTLIDDLLAFSKIGKKELKRSNVNMVQLVEAVLHEAQKGNHIATVELKEILPAFCDQALVYQVWTNLISNAIKYSSNKQKPLIEIGSNLAHDGSYTTYYVKDNGAGFNMKYANKLFGVFQRLHSDTEFEGTGVGLAIVYRIITKHGGRIWAESEEQVGSTFYFTLPA